jgi:hypothetical protein
VFLWALPACLLGKETKVDAHDDARMHRAPRPRRKPRSLRNAATLKGSFGDPWCVVTLYSSRIGSFAKIWYDSGFV